MLIRQPVIKQTHCDIDIEKIKQLLPNIKTKEQANNTIYIEYINNQKCLNGNVHKSNNAIVYIHWDQVMLHCFSERCTKDQLIYTIETPEYTDQLLKRINT